MQFTSADMDMAVFRDGRMVPVRAIGEIHVRHTVGHIPTIRDYLEQMAMKPWMYEPGDGRYVLAISANTSWIM